MSSAVVTVDEQRETVIDALRRLRGRATVADIVAATGLVQARAESALRSILETHRGHVEVGDRGDIVYAFDARLLSRDHVPWWRRVVRGLKRVAKTAFKAWIALTLVAYFVIFLVLAVAAIVVVIAKKDDVDLPRGRHFRMDWLWFLFWAPDWRWGAPYYGHRYERMGGRKRRVPFYKKVFAFVFGPDQPVPSQEQRDREHVRLIRARDGVLATADLVMHTGDAPERAHEELGRLLGALDGDASATPEGEVVYRFPDLMVSAHGRVSATPPDPAWRQLKPSRPITGNSIGSNLAIAGINAFNLAGVASAVLFVFPTLGIGGPVAWTALVWFPLAFTILFFAIPAVRTIGVRRDNAKRRADNVRRVVLGQVFDAALADEAVTAGGIRERVAEALPDAVPTSTEVERILRDLLAEWDGEVETGADGALRYRFARLRSQIEAAAAARAALRYGERRVGEVVYSSADDADEASRRDLATFDRDLRRSLEPGRVAWVDEVALLEPAER